jgi:hypothetical protein
MGVERGSWNWVMCLSRLHRAQPSLLRGHSDHSKTGARAGVWQAFSCFTLERGTFLGQDFALRPDGTLRCLADKTLRSTEHRREADGSLRVLYSARIRDCPPAQSVRSVSGTGKPSQSRAGEVASCILFGLGSRLRLRRIGAGENTDVLVCNWCDTNGSR